MHAHSTIITTICNSSPINFKQLHQIITDLRFEHTDQAIHKRVIQNSKNLKCANEIENWNWNETNLLEILWCNTRKVETEATIDEEKKKNWRERDGSRKRHSVAFEIEIMRIDRSVWSEWMIFCEWWWWWYNKGVKNKIKDEIFLRLDFRAVCNFGGCDCDTWWICFWVRVGMEFSTWFW